MDTTKDTDDSSRLLQEAKAHYLQKLVCMHDRYSQNNTSTRNKEKKRKKKK